MAAECTAQVEARGGLQMTTSGRAAIGGETESGASKRAGNIDEVSGFRSTAQERFAGGHGAATDDIAGNAIGAREVATGQNYVVSFCESQEAVVETVDPRRCEVFGEREREKAEAGLA